MHHQHMSDITKPYDNIPLGDMKKVYVCSPVKGDQNSVLVIKDNIARAALYSKFIFENGYLPICPHIYLEAATGLNEANSPGDREPVIRLGLELLILCDELWVFGVKPGGESSGMKNEIKEAEKRGIKVVYRNEYLK